MRYSIMCKTKQRLNKKKIHGFDIETYDDNKKFLLLSVSLSDGTERKYRKVDDFIYDLKHDKIFRNSIIFATNLSFDFFGTFFGNDNIKNFDTLFRDSNLIYSRTYIEDDDFTLHPKSTKRFSLKFLDTMNFAPLSVDKMGKILGLPKLKNNVKKILGKYPKNDKEWKLIEEYNLRDSTISRLFANFLINEFENLGATVKNTVAGTALSLFKNKYLDKDYFRADPDELIFQFKSYYGGMCQTVKRGYFKGKMYYYDFNSKYPDVMRRKYPDPNTLRVCHFNNIDKIMQYEGCSEIDISVPRDEKFPLLPYRNGEKIIYPTGEFHGTWTHYEIRKTLERGAEILKVYKTHYYLKTCTPFRDYVTDLYSGRMKCKKEGSPLEIVYKLMMNGLYGKFAQKFIDRNNYIPAESLTFEELKKYDKVTRIGDYFLVENDAVEPAAHCFPIWASYVTAYGRIDLIELAEKHDAVYCDTDSIFIDHEIPSSEELGDMKLECVMTELCIVRPKFYAYMKDKNFVKPGDDDYQIRIKGFSRAISFLKIGDTVIDLDDESRKDRFLLYDEFFKIIDCKNVSYNKFTKFRECLRRGLLPNENIITKKKFSIEDDKRHWPAPFNVNEWQSSSPLNISTIEQISLNKRVNSSIPVIENKS